MSSVEAGHCSNASSIVIFGDVVQMGLPACSLLSSRADAWLGWLLAPVSSYSSSQKSRVPVVLWVSRDESLTSLPWLYSQPPEEPHPLPFALF